MSYEGTWENDKANGFGRLVLQQYVYEGQLRNNKLEGFGTKYSVEGSQYTGEYKNNLRDG